MPGGDRTGPMGLGAKTSRGLGLCSGAEAVEGGPALGKGLGCRRGLRQRTGRRLNCSYIAAKNYKELLQEQKCVLQNRLEAIDRYMETM